MMEYDGILLCSWQHTNSDSQLYCRRHIMSLPLQTEYKASKFAMKAYGEGKENLYVPIRKDTKESRESAERFIRQQRRLIV